jgi:hypothetical protein
MRECLSFLETIAAATLGVLLAEILWWSFRALFREEE